LKVGTNFDYRPVALWVDLKHNSIGSLIGVSHCLKALSVNEQLFERQLSSGELFPSTASFRTKLEDSPKNL
jgi:hypothetical protein